MCQTLQGEKISYFQIRCRYNSIPQWCTLSLILGKKLCILNTSKKNTYEFPFCTKKKDLGPVNLGTKPPSTYINAKNSPKMKT